MAETYIGMQNWLEGSSDGDVQREACRVPGRTLREGGKPTDGNRGRE